MKLLGDVSVTGSVAVEGGREKQLRRDAYYMALAEAVERGADCLGTQVGAVLVLEDRVISTGYNGTPSGFPNCKDRGCVRCYDSWLIKADRAAEASDPTHVSGRALDRCICVHGEQNALITAAPFGIRVAGASLYTTQSPCFGCLKEAVQADIQRIIYKDWYAAHYSGEILAQYWALAQHLSEGDSTRFEALGGQASNIREEGQPDPYSDEAGSTLEPPHVAA